MQADSIRAVLFCLLLYPATSRADNPKYAISDIPSALLIDSKAVIRKQDIVFEIADYDKAVLKVTYAITILNRNGISNSVLVKGYDKFSSVRKINATLYDGNGKQIRTGLNTNATDVAALSGYSLYSDNRLKVYDPGYTTTPFTVEYTYEISYDGLFNYPSWILYEDYNVAVENSTFRIISPEGFRLRYLEQNLKGHCNTYNKPSKILYEWAISGLPALKKELYSPDPEEYSPAVFVAPDDFEMGGIRGNCESWSTLGLWIKKLGENKTLLGQKTRETVKSITSEAGDDYGKVKLLYNYLQNKVRYVSITEGLGGWQPIDAETVDRVSYGDCKALANYMKALLDIAGITSYYTIIRAGENAPGLRDGFPSNQFNHAIVCVPVKNDTIWLECTDQQIPFGFLGSFTDDRKALIISESGGKIVNTTAYSAGDNKQIRNITVKMNDDGSAAMSVNTSYTGIKYDERSRVLRMDDEDRKRFIYSTIKIAGGNLASFNYSQDKSIVPSLSEELKISIPAYATITGRGLILRPNLFTRLSDIPLRSVQRKAPVCIRRSFCEYDTVTYFLPVRFRSDNKPGKFSLKTPFGEYDSEYYYTDSKLTYIRGFKLLKGNFPVEMYEAFVDFFEKVNNEDNRQIALTR